MKYSTLITAIALIAIFSINHCTGTTQFINKPIDSTYFKNKTVYLTLSPLTLSLMKTRDSGNSRLVYSGKVGVNFLTKKYHKFQVFGSIGRGIQFRGGLKTMEFGVTIGKLYPVGESEFFDVNVGLSYVGGESKTVAQSGSFWDGSYTSNTKVNHINTYGIPFEAMYYTSRYFAGAGVGFIGNLNIEQPYIGIQLSVRLGNPLIQSK